MNSTYDLEEINGIERFLLENGYTHTNAEVLDYTAKLVCKCLSNPNLVMNEAYAEIAATASDAENCRAKIGYHIGNNFLSVKEKLLAHYDFDLGKRFSGVKDFIEKIAMVYSVYTRN